MSYSKVKKNGFPDLGKYQMAYHIVREADLLAAYDIDRCIIYQMEKFNTNFTEAFSDAKNLFEVRVLKHFDDNLFVTNYAKNLGKILHEKALQQINRWEKIMNKPFF